MPAELDRIAVGHDNVIGLEAWREIAPPAFHKFRYPTETEWWEAEGRRMNSLGLPKDYGAPLAIVIFETLTVAEFQLLRTYEGDVTYHGYDKVNDSWENFNGYGFIERLTPDNWANGRWVNVRYHVVQLEEL